MSDPPRKTHDTLGVTFIGRTMTSTTAQRPIDAYLGIKFAEFEKRFMVKFSSAYCPNRNWKRRQPWLSAVKLANPLTAIHYQWNYSWVMTNYPTMRSHASHVSNYVRTVVSPKQTRQYPTVKIVKLWYDLPTPPSITIVASTSNFC